ncbi:MAG: DNRLRE domain-containing protein [Ignavibacteria bacterium]|nr:DNRLRE domain-containing protein [Ignavibacteria bacterium]
MKLLSSLLFSAMLIFSLTSCNEEPTTAVTSEVKLNKFEIPAGATIDYATFYIYSKAPKGNTTYGHNITADWQECVVTWNSFNYSFDPTVVDQFDNSTVGWKSLDITSLVAGWVAGTLPNYGVLIKDNLTDVGYIFERSLYDSRETANAPYIELCYTYNGVQTCTTDVAIEDVYIWQLNPDVNYCTNYPNLYTGARATGQEKYSLLKFEFETPPPVVYNCETAYAYGEGNSLSTLCFLDIPNKQGNNWGWTNQIGPGTYNWPIYAGAGQCDISKGTLVGTLDVVYASGEVTITYNIDPLYTLGDTHVWVGEGENLLPKKSNGKWDSAPGQFNHNGVNPVVVSGLTGNIWIAAHSGVCWEVQ